MIFIAATAWLSFSFHDLIALTGSTEHYTSFGMNKGSVDQFSEDNLRKAILSWVAPNVTARDIIKNRVTNQHLSPTPSYDINGICENGIVTLPGQSQMSVQQSYAFMVNIAVNGACPMERDMIVAFENDGNVNSRYKTQFSYFENVVEIALWNRKHEKNLVAFITSCRANHARFFEDGIFLENQALPNSSVYASLQRSHNSQICVLKNFLNKTKKQHQLISFRFIDLTGTSSESDSSEEDSPLPSLDELSTDTSTEADGRPSEVAALPHHEIIRESPWNMDIWDAVLDAHYLRGTISRPLLGANDSGNVPNEDDGDGSTGPFDTEEMDDAT